VNLNVPHDSPTPSPRVPTSKFRWQWENQEEDAASIDLFLKNRFQKLYPGHDGSDFSQSRLYDSLLASLPSPFLFPQMEKAVERLLEARHRQELVVIFGDFDVDGTTSCALLELVFKGWGFKTAVYIPDRLVEGYGLNPVGVTNVHNTGASLIVTVDNGISSLEACEVATQLGVDVIITDHHDLPPVLPSCLAILNPKIPSDFPFSQLAGVGVAFYLAMGLRSKLKEQKDPAAQSLNLKSYLDFVAIGTIADMAPLVGLNHLLCRVGLQVLAQHIKAGGRPGVANLLRLCKWDPESPIGAYDVGFKIAPRLNAAGRLGSALASQKLLSTNHPEEALSLAEFLHQENADRRRIEKEFLEEAFGQILAQKKVGNRAQVLFGAHWHPGVVGLMASRLVERVGLPVLVLCEWEGKIKGSGRSIATFDLFAHLSALREFFAHFGGHPAACGLTLKEGVLEDFRRAFESTSESALASLRDLRAPLTVVGSLPLQAFTLEEIDRLQHLEPYGIQNPKPQWLVPQVRCKHLQRLGKNSDSPHASCQLSQNGVEMRMVAFDGWDRLKEKVDFPWDVVVEPIVNSWRGKRNVELRLVDFQISQEI
jgi:single-stranded-DNA-specific exonuclease